MRALSVIWKILPIVRELEQMLRRDSDGGKKITKEERDILIRSTLSLIGLVLEREF